MRTTRSRAGLVAGAVAVALSCVLSVPVVPALAQQAPAPAPAPVTYTVDETKLPFEATAGTTTRREWGVLDGAGYRIEVPANWNGELVTYSHGFVSPLQPALETPLPPLRDHYISQGYAWASTSYSKNGYVVEEGVRETQALLGKFAELVRPAERVYATGVSMGGHVVGALIERFPDTYAGALPVCGVMGDEALFDFYLGHASVAQTLAGGEASFPPPADYLTEVAPAIRDELGPGPGVPLNGGGHQLAAVTEQLRGGERPLFEQAFDFWSDTRATAGLPFLLGVYGGALTGGPASVANDFATNVGQSYQLDDDPAVSPLEQALNAAVARRAQTGAAPWPVIEGTLGSATKVLTLHTIGDLFVPFSMQQVYRREALAKGTADRLVQRAIRDVGHCTFTPQEAVRAFADLVAWVERDVKPAGDDILDPAVVADRDFGCAFTQGEHKGIPACRTAPALLRAAGADRIGTALDLVRRSYDTADTVVLARADAYADALAGGPLAASLDAPVLLTGGDRLPAAVLAEIDRLGATQAYVLGGPRAVSTTVGAQLAAAGLTRTVRLGGRNRFDTARLIAEEAGGRAGPVGVLVAVRLALCVLHRPRWRCPLRRTLRSSTVAGGALPRAALAQCTVRMLAHLAASLGRRAAATVAAPQSHVVSRRQLYAAGVPRWLVRHELKIGRWQRTGSQTLVLHTGPLDAPARRWVAVLEAGPRAVLDGVTALQAAGLDTLTDEVIVIAVPKGNRRRRIAGARVRETRRYREQDVVRRGVPRTVPAVAAVHAALWAASDKQATFLLTLVVQQGLVRPSDLSDAATAVRRHRRRRLIAQVVLDLAAGCRSLGELDVARSMRRRGLPEPARQVVRHRPSGKEYLDADFPAYLVTMEVDGAQHDLPDQRLADLLRDLGLATDRRTVVRIPLVAWRLDEEAVLDALEELFLSRGWRRPAA